ncbi:MAG: glycosyltransferase family 39 protein [Chloroflexi bacterium]|nr:glycosyltransferase family 39 protein [Chloroflexota bacterium]
MSTLTKTWVEHRALVLILAAFIALGVTYSIITPIFEAGDEIWHYPFVQHLAAGHGLPIQDPNVKTLWEQEGGQPPLYYAINALATFWIDTRDLPDRLWLNPHARIGIPLDFGNKNLVVHTSAESFPWHNTALAVHLIRLLSILMSAGTVTLTYALVLVIASHTAVKQFPTPPQPSPWQGEGERGVIAASQKSLLAMTNDKTLAAFAAAFVAFNPMFLFISASVNNDNLATLLATLALVLMARLVTRGVTMRRFVVLGVVLGLGALTKISNLGLLGVAGCVFVYLLLGRGLTRTLVSPARAGVNADRKYISTLVRVLRNPRPIIIGSLICAALVVLIAFWWYARNWMLYGDPSAFDVWVAIAGGRPTPMTITGLFNEFQGFRISFWGNFGGVNIIAPEWVYSILDAFTVLALVGLLIGVWRRALPGLLAIPALWFVLINLSLVRWTWLTMASQGRLIFPAIGALAVLFVYGLGQFRIQNSEFRIQNHVLLLPFAFLLLAFSLLAPFTLIAPTYTLPPRFADASRVPNQTQIIFDNQAELIGYALAQKSIAPGGELPITLYWRARETMGEDFSVGIRLIDSDGNVVGRWDAFSGRGLYPTRVWQPGEIVVDEYRVPLVSDARTAQGARVDVTLYRRAPLENLTARDPRGNAITPNVARFKIAGQSQIQIENPVRYDFADQVALVGYAIAPNAHAGESLRVRLFWRALKSLDEDYTVFVHLVDANGKLIAQKDDQPQHGAYPTSLWDAGEIVADEYALTLPRDAPPGEYRVIVGLYRASDVTRLPVNGGDAITLSTIQFP